MSNTFDKLAVLESFIEEVNSYLPEIETNLENLAQSPGDMDTLEETYRRTHTIGGSASMMDFPGLAHVAHGMEDILGDALDGLTTLDEPAIGLLRRSLGRLHQLLEGIRSGIDEEAVIAEDDADYSRYRAALEAPLPSGLNENGVGSLMNDQMQMIDPFSSFTNGQMQAINPSGSLPQSQFSSAEIPSLMSSSLPSFDEVLASFRTPAVMPGEDIAWPEEPVPSSHFDDATAKRMAQQEIPLPASEPVLPVQPTQATQLPPAQSAWDELFAATHQMPAPLAPPPATVDYSVNNYAPPPEVSDFSPVNPVNNYVPPPATVDYPVNNYAPPSVTSDFGAVNPVNNYDYTALAENLYAPAPGVDERLPYVPVTSPDEALPSVQYAFQTGMQALESLAASLRNAGAQLRATMSIIETQRGEFKGFLDGSKDALDRMEDWAGQAMGLNLRNSPEQVRRYLPLSVMWVSNSKLKKSLDLLNQIASGIEMTDEQMAGILYQFNSSIESFSEVFQQMQAQASRVLSQEPGWGSWEMQQSGEVRDRITFERRGDLTAMRAEMEAELREELRQEYESRPLSLAMRAELEQQIRSEMRQEFEERRRLQESVAGLESNEAFQELEARLRSEIEIQVRQDFLSQIAQAGGDPALAAQMSAPIRDELTLPPPATPSGFMNRIRDVANRFTGGLAVPPPQPPSVAAVPATPPLAPPQPPKAAQTSAYAGDFGEEAAEIFRLEAEEHLQTIGMHVAALEKDPTNRDLIQGIRRATHTLKGAAGMMGFRAIADLCHISEDLLDSIMEGTTAITPTVLSLILDTAEALDTLIAGREPGAIPDEERVQIMRARYVGLLGEQNTTRSSADEYLDVDVDAPFVSGVVADGHAPETNAQRAARGDLSVRVRLQKLDELVNLFGELLVNRSVLDERMQRLARLVADVSVSSNRLRDVGQKLESRFEAATLPSGRSVQVMPGQGDQSLIVYGSNNKKGSNGQNGVDQSHLAEFDELELDRYTEFHQIARGLSESILDMSTLSTEMDTVIRECESVFARESRLSTAFQDRLMKTRLVPLSTMVPRLYRAARAVGLKQHKDFEFLLEGETTEVDRTVFEEIAGPLLHLMRNAVNHAIETPEVRIQKGKAPTGQIKLSASYEGNQVVITVRDDGVGIDPDVVRQTAIARGIIRPDQVLNESDLIELIFRPGFSTAEVLSEESGRGVGLDVVRDSVARLRGSLVVDSMPGQGTSFTMTFPTSLAIQSAMMVRAGHQQFAIPTVMVEAIGRLDNFKRSTANGQPAVLVQNELYPLQLLAQYLALPTNTVLDDKAQLLFVNANGQRMALIVDEIKGKSDIVMKNLGPHLRHVHGVAGGTVLGNGQVVLILELNELLSRLRPGTPVAAGLASPRRESTQPSPALGRQRIDVAAMASRQRQAPAAPIPERGKHILVVDDSPSVRRVVSSMLKQHGWEVQAARDGAEALEMISLEVPAAVLLDIEMPRMDGYELISTIRAQEQYRTLPLVVLTSRAAAKYQQRAMMLGASGYVVKPYQDEELLGILNSLVYGAAVN
ncbi:MAG TPA: response regulator [Ktedonobacteraceae bacterium]|nr:response regulator [Ktedonobacteraceae bacterium]